jgi:3-hydroxybutyryl-CoA dehydratase
MELLFTKDFDMLETGETFATPGRTITETDVVSFGTLTGDLHPQHLDAAWAAESQFGHRIAHGMLVLSYAFGLVPLDPDRVVALRRVRDVVFKRPVALGDTIHVEGQIERVTALDETTGLVACTWNVKNQRGRLVVRASVEVLWRRGGAADPTANGKAALESLPLTI